MLDKVQPPETADRAEAEEAAEAAEREALPRTNRFRQVWPHRLTSRIVLLNLLGLIVLVAGILYFNQFRQGLIDARVQSLTTQAQIIAAAVAGSATVDTGSIVLQRAIVPPDLTDPEAVAAALHEVEHELLPEAVRLFARGAVRRDAAEPRRLIVG